MFGPGPLTREEAMQLRAMLQHGYRPVTVIQPLGKIEDSSGLTLYIDASAITGTPILAKITQVHSSNNFKYDWVELDISSSGVVSELENGRSGTLAKNTHAFELTNREVDVDTYVLIHQTVNGVRWFSECELACCCEPDADGNACNLAALSVADCLLATSGNQTIYLVYTEASAGNSWVSTEEMTYPGGSGTLEFTFADGIPRLDLDGMPLLYCGDNCWSGGPLTGHAETPESTCAGETFQVCLTCSCCPVDGWAGSGYYCIEDDEGDCVEVALLDTSNNCAGDDAPVICSGPYATAELAAIICQPDPDEVTRACSSINGSTITAASFVAKTGDCTCLPDTPATAYNGSDTWNITTSSCPGNVTLALKCTGGFWALTTGTGGITILLISASATQLVYKISGYGANCGGSGGTAHLILTGTF